MATEIECYYCKKKGHLKMNCRKRIREEQSGHSEKDSVGAFITTCSNRANNGSDECAVREGSVGNREDSRRATTVDQEERLLNLDTEEVWLTDSGASRHITFRKDWLSEFCPSDNEIVSLGNNCQLKSLGSGTVYIKKLVNVMWKDGRIDNVLYVPTIRKNLFSVGVCTTKNYEVRFKERHVRIYSNGLPVGEGVRQKNDIFRMLFKVIKSAEANTVENDLKTWHDRLGHINQRSLQRMEDCGLIKNTNSESKDFFCEACQEGKLHRKPFVKREHNKLWKTGEMFHSDVCGPMSTESIGGAKFFLTFKDEATNFRTVYFLRHKSDVYEKFKEFERFINNKFGRSMKVLRTDNGREYCNHQMTQYLKLNGIVMENTAPFSPEQNGKAERDNRTIVESARSMMQAAALPKYLWTEAVNIAVYILNRTIPAQGEAVTPFQKWTGKKPCLSHIRIFGCEAFVHVPKQLRTKFDSKAKKLILVGYQGESNNYRLFDSTTRKVSVARDVAFYERRHHWSSFNLYSRDSHFPLQRETRRRGCATKHTRSPGRRGH